MNRRIASRTLLLSGLALGTVAAALPVCAQDAYHLRRVYKAGETDKYKTTIAIQGSNPMGGGAMKVELTLLMTETTKEVKEDGTVTVVTTIESGTVNFNGMEQSLPNQGQTITTTFDKSGKLVKEEGAPGVLGGMLGFTRVGAMPDRPLRVGEEWKFDIPINEAKQQRVKGTVTLLSLEKKSEDVPIDTLKIRSVVDTPLTTPQGDQQMHLEATTFVEPGTGKAIKVEGVITGQIGPINDAKVIFKRIRVEK